MGERKRTGRYSRFWAAFKRLSLGGNDAEGVKEVLVSQYTNGRTVHLHEMRDCEYVRLCEAVERDVLKDERLKMKDERSSRHGSHWIRAKAGAGLKALRSRVLVEMRLWGGVAGLHHNSVNWSEVDRFCLNRRIAGKRFCLLNEEELEALLKKLIAMNQKRLEVGK